MSDIVRGPDREIADLLTLLLGYHQLLLDGSMGPLSQAQRKVVAELVQHAERLREVFRKIRDPHPIQN